MRDYELDPKGHTWRKNENGSTDILGFDADTCNGPLCTTCGYGFCHHCHKTNKDIPICRGGG